MSSVAFEDGGAYQSLQAVLQNAFGVVVGDERQQSITAMLEPVLSDYSFSSLEELADALEKGDSGNLRNSVLQAITTHEDEWFSPQALNTLLDGYLVPDMLASGKDQYRIWVISSNGGQLPYSLAMRLKETAATVNVTIDATDISEQTIKQAEAGLYDEASMNGMDAESRKKYMHEQGGQWCVNDDIRTMVSFSTCNLLDDFEERGHYDLIICLDSLVYYSLAIKNMLLDSFAKLLDPSGILVPGVNDPMLPMNQHFERVQHEAGTFYRQVS